MYFPFAEHQLGCFSKVLWKIADTWCCVGGFTRPSMDFCNHAIDFAIIPQRNCNAKVNTLIILKSFHFNGLFDDSLEHFSPNHKA